MASSCHWNDSPEYIPDLWWWLNSEYLMDASLVSSREEREKQVFIWKRNSIGFMAEMAETRSELREWEWEWAWAWETDGWRVGGGVWGWCMHMRVGIGGKGEINHWPTVMGALNPLPFSFFPSVCFYRSYFLSLFSFPYLLLLTFLFVPSPFLEPDPFFALCCDATSLRVFCFPFSF